jgi:hypothetical protein
LWSKKYFHNFSNISPFYIGSDNGTQHRAISPILHSLALLIAAEILPIFSRPYSTSAFLRPDLSPNSQSVKEINDAFGERPKELELVSFWESTGNWNVTRWGIFQ